MRKEYINCKNMSHAEEQVKKESVSVHEESSSLSPIAEIGDVIERLRQTNPLCGGFLSECDCCVSDDRKLVVIRTVNEFGIGILRSNEQAILSALRLCGVTEPDAVLKLETGAAPKKEALDELSEL